MPKPLTIGVDVRSLRVAKTGIRTYLEEICLEFKKMKSEDLRFYFLDSSLPIYTGRHKILKWIEHLSFQFWKQLALPLKAFFKHCDIVFCTDDCVPLIHLNYKTIPVFHDAFCFESPENYGKLWLWLYKKTAVPAAKRSPFVITPTVWSKKQIHRFTQITDEKLVVVYEGVKILDHNNSDTFEQLLNSFGLVPHNYILHVGSMFKRKNLPTLVKAFSEIKKMGYQDLKLVLAGSSSKNTIDSDYNQVLDIIKNNGLENDVVLTGYMTDNDLGQLYKNALMYVFPSFNEGFGLPVLEAFEANLPVIVSNNTCLPEVGGDAVLQFDPLNTDELVGKIKQVLDDPELRKEMIARGQKRLQDFSWHKAATEIVEVFRRAV